MRASWRARLRPASFRGVSFYVDSGSGAGGRRGPDHEYPGRDTPYAEDLGRKQHVWNFNAYLIGDNYAARRDQLARVCDQKGSGELIHPTYGAVEVVCRSWSYTEERERGRYCTFQLEFHEAGQLQEPSDAQDADAAVGSAADPVGTSATQSFLGSFSTEGGGAWLTSAAATDIEALAQTLEQLRFPAATQPQSQLGQALDYLTDNAGALAADPPALAGRTDQAFQYFTEAGEAQPVVTAMLRFVNPEETAAAALAMRAAHTGVDLPYVIRRAQNRASFENFTHRLALREIGYAVTGLDLDNYDEAWRVLDAITDAFRRIEDAAADAGDDDEFIALISLRAAITRMVKARAAALTPLVTYYVLGGSPANALTLAWRLYQDTGRDLELVARVKARNPAFLPMSGRVLAA